MAKGLSILIFICGRIFIYMYIYILQGFFQEISEGGAKHKK